LPLINAELPFEVAARILKTATKAEFVDISLSQKALDILASHSQTDASFLIPALQYLAFLLVSNPFLTLDSAVLLDLVRTGSFAVSGLAAELLLNTQCRIDYEILGKLGDFIDDTPLGRYVFACMACMLLNGEDFTLGVFLEKIGEIEAMCEREEGAVASLAGFVCDEIWKLEIDHSRSFEKPIGI
jgi:hypothetical protein